MARVGLIYQGRYHLIVVEELARKVLGNGTELVPRMGGSWPGIVGELTGLLEALHVEHIHDPMRKVVVVVDADKAEPVQREEKLRLKVGNRKYGFATIHYHAIAREIETWLLGDPETLNGAAGRNLPRTPDPELLLGPKQHLIQKLHNVGIEYGSDFVRRAATAIDLNRLGATCKRFRKFREQLHDC